MSNFNSLAGAARITLHHAVRSTRYSAMPSFYVGILLAAFTNAALALPQGSLPGPVAPVVANCRTTPGSLQVASISGSSDSSKVKIQADEISYPGRNIAHLRGFVELVRGSHRLYADELIYDKSETRAVAKGSVKFQNSEGDIIFTSILRYYIATGKIVSGSANFIIASRNKNLTVSKGSTVDSYGTASRITLLAGNVMYLENAEITQCRDGKEYSIFTAGEIRVDLDEGMRTAKKVKIRIAPPDRNDRIQEKAK